MTISGGHIVAIDQRVEGKLHGLRKTFWTSGKLCSITNFDYDKRHGQCTSYYIDGETIRSVKYYVGNVLHGPLTEYSEDGETIRSVKIYCRGELVETRSPP